MSDAAPAAAAAPAVSANVNAPSQPANTTPPPAKADAPAKGSAENAETKPAGPKYYEIEGERVSADEYKRMKSLASGSHKKFEEAAQMRKEAENVLSKLRDPKQAIRLLEDPKLGLSREQIIGAMEEWYNERVIEPSKLTPEQQKLKDAEERLAEYKAKEDAEKAKEQEDQEKQRDQDEAKRLQSEVLEALKTSGLPKTRFTASRMAHWMRVNEMKGLNAPAALLIEQVRKETRDLMGSLLEASDGDTLANLLGENTIKKVRKYDIERIRARRGQGTEKPVVERDASPAVEERLSIEEVKRRERDPNLWK